MNSEDWTESEHQTCNICDSPIEIGSASSRCSNRNCLTRRRDNTLSTDASAMDVAEWFRELDPIARDEVDSAVERRYQDYRRASTAQEMHRLHGQVDALLGFSSYEGWGALAERAEQ